MNPINIFSIVFIIVMLGILFDRSNLKQKYLHIIIFLMLIQVLNIRGYFLVIGTKELSYEFTVSLSILILSMIYLIKSKRMIWNKKYFVYMFFFLSTAMISWILETMFPYENPILDAYIAKANWDAYIAGLITKTNVKIGFGILTYLPTALGYFLCFGVLKSIGEKKDFVGIIEKINKIIPFFLFVFIFEFIDKTILNGDIFEPVMDFIFGTGNNTYTELLLRGDTYQLQGLSKEPSHYACTLYFFLIFLFLEKILKRNTMGVFRKIEVILILCLMFASGSFSACMYVCILLLLLFWYKYNTFNNNTYKIMLIGIMFIVFFLGFAFLIDITVDDSSYLSYRFFMLFTAFDLIQNGNVNLFEADSALIRMVSIYDTACDFLHRPLFGLGPMVQISHGGLVNLLSDVGIAGAFFWWKASFSVYVYRLMPIIIILFLPNLFSQTGLSSTAFALYTPVIIECFRKK